MGNEDLRRLESRWRVIATVVLVLVGVGVVLVVAWLSTSQLRFAGPWDWVVEHHRLLVVILVVAVAVGCALLITSWRTASWRRLAWVLVPFAVVVLVVGGWIIADRRSNAGDIASRVHEVEVILPSGAVQNATTQGDNYLDRSYAVDGDLDSVSAALWSAAQQRLGPDAGVWADPRQGTTPSDIEASYRGRNGCDGSVEVSVALTPGESDTTNVRISGHCED
jgi:hypothetical protein